MTSKPRALLPRQSYWFFTAILVGLLLLNWKIFQPFVIFMVAGIFVAVLASPIDRWFEKRRLHNRIAAVLTMITLAVLLTLPVIGLGLALAGDAQDLTNAIQEGQHDAWVAESLNSTLIQTGLAYAYPSNTTDERNATVMSLFEDVEATAITQLARLGREVAAALPDFFIAMTVILFVVYYVLTDGGLLIAYLKRASPVPAKQMDYLLLEAHNGVRAVFIGQILTSSIQGALGGIGFLIAGLPGAIVWAALMAVLSLLPVVGAFLVWVPATLFLFFQWSNGDIALWKPVFLLIWGVIVVSQVDNLIRPRLIGDRANIHPMFVLIGVLGGVAAFGFIGLFLGPLIVGVTLSVLRVWESDYLDPSVGVDDPTVRHVVAGAATIAQMETKLGRPPTEDELADAVEAIAEEEAEEEAARDAGETDSSDDRT